MAPDPLMSNAGSGASAAHGGVAAGERGIAVGGNVEGGIHYHEAASTLILRATPPAPPPHFTGRAADLARFARLLTSGQNVAITALHGMGGIGKTSLALKLAEQIGGGDPAQCSERSEGVEGRPYFPGGVLWRTLGPHPDVFTALDVWARHADPRADLSALPTAEDRAEVVRAMLAQLGRLCVMIDDVWDETSFNLLKGAVPPGCPILITTRDADLAKSLRCRVERLDALSDDEAVALLVNLLGPLNGYEEAACDIAHLTEGLPLALELIAGLADAPSDLPALATELRTRPTLEVLKRGKTREQSIEVCFTLSYERLDAGLQRRFRALGVFAPAPFERGAIAAVWDEDDAGVADASVDAALKFLVRRSLLTRVSLSHREAAQSRSENPAETSAPEYRQHALLRDYALKLLSEPSPQPSPLKGEGEAYRHAAYYRRFAKEQNWRTVEHFFDQIDHGWQWVQAHAPDQIINYVFAVRGFLRTRGRQVERTKWLKIGLQQAQNTADRKAESDILNSIALACGDLGQPDKALDFYQQALVIQREVGDRSGEGITLNNLGRVYDDLGQPDKTLDFYQQALAIRREVGDRSGEGITLNNFGLVYNALGQPDKALDFFQQALAIHREVGNRSTEGITLNNLGLVYKALGQPDKALDFFQQALAILREVGDRSGEGTTLNNLGAVYKALGQPDKALDFYQQALAIRREVGDRSGEGTTLNNLGAVYNALGQKDKALDFFQQALVILREVGNRFGESITLFNIGQLLDQMGRPAEAVSFLEQNVALDEAIGHPDLESDRAALERVRAKLGQT